MMDPSQAGALIDDVYAASVDPSRWTGVVESLGRALQAEAGLMMIPASFGATPASFASFGIAFSPEVARYYETIRGKATLTNAAMATGRAPGVFTLDELVPETERSHSDFWRRGLAPLGWTDGLIAVLRLPAEEEGPPVILNYFRRQSGEPMRGGPRALLEALFPHLRRAVGITLAVGSGRALARTLDAFIETLGEPCLMIDNWGVVSARNEAFDRLAGERGEFRLAGGQLTFADRDDQQRLDRWLTAARAGETAPGDFPISVRSGASALFVSLSPMGASEANDMQPRHLVRFVDTGSGVSGNAHRRLRDFFGLTQAEAAVALALGQSQTVDEIAAARGVSVATVRLQIKSALQKTQLHRQGALAALAARLIL